MTRLLLVIVAAFGCLWCGLLVLGALAMLWIWWIGGAQPSVRGDEVFLVFVFALLLAPPGLGIAFLAIRDLRRQSRFETHGFEPVLPVRAWPPAPAARRVIPIAESGSTVGRTILLSVFAAVGYLWFSYCLLMVMGFVLLVLLEGAGWTGLLALIPGSLFALLGVPGLMIARAATRSLRGNVEAEPRGFEPIEPRGFQPIVKPPETSVERPDQS